MLSRIGEFFWRGQALERVRTRDVPDAGVLRIVLDLVEASEAVGFAASTVRAQRVLLGEASARMAKLGPGEGPLLERVEIVKRFPAKVVEGARRALAGDAPKVEDLLQLFGLLRTLVEEARQVVNGPGRLRQQRWARLAAVAGVVALAVTLLSVWPWWLRNKASGAEWQASSAYPGWKPEGRLGWSSAEAFFHTQREDNPWLIVDLGRSRDLDRIRVVNRDHTPERALPLEIEGSEDRVHWVKLAERTQPFAVWVAEVPGTEARYLRFRVPRKTWLHLKGIQVL